MKQKFLAFVGMQHIEPYDKAEILAFFDGLFIPLNLRKTLADVSTLLSIR